MKRVIVKACSEFISWCIYPIYLIKWHKPARPDKIIWVNTEEIKWSIEFSNFVNSGRYMLSGIILTGEWSKGKKLGSSRIYERKMEAFKYLFVDSKNKQSEHPPPLDITDRKLLRMKNKYQDLFDEVSKNGFKVPKSIFDDIDYFKLSIGPKGEFLFMTGKHRMTIARLLGEKYKLPVKISHRHAEWQKYRDQLYLDYKDGKIDKEEIIELNHPDLLDLIE